MYFLDKKIPKKGNPTWLYPLVEFPLWTCYFLWIWLSFPSVDGEISLTKFCRIGFKMPAAIFKNFQFTQIPSQSLQTQQFQFHYSADIQHSLSHGSLKFPANCHFQIFSKDSWFPAKTLSSTDGHLSRQNINSLTSKCTANFNLSNLGTQTSHSRKFCLIKFSIRFHFPNFI